MIKSKEEKIRQFSDNALNVTAQLAKMKFPQFEDRIESFKNNNGYLESHEDFTVLSYEYREVRV